MDQPTAQSTTSPPGAPGAHANGLVAGSLKRPPLAALAVLRPDVFDGSTTFNRDLSWLEFNRRVLALAQDERTPLLERVRFLAIFSSNLDEFVMKRMGLLHRRVEIGANAPDQDGVAVGDLLNAIRKTVGALQHEQSDCWEHSVKPALAAEGIAIVDASDMSQEERRWLRKWFRKNVFPVLTPLAVDQGHRFPFISNQSRNLGVLLAEPGVRPEPSALTSSAGTAAHALGGQTPAQSSAIFQARRGYRPGDPLFARVKIPDGIGQWVRLPEDPDSPVPAAGAAAAKGAAPAPGVSRGRFITLREVIAANLDDLFPGMQILEIVPFRVLRDAEADGTEAGSEADDLLLQVEEQLKKRRFARSVRMEIAANPSPRVLGSLAHELKLTQADIEQRAGLLDYTILTEIADLDRPEHKWPRWTPVVPGRLAESGVDMFSVIRQGDLLVHHPFESFAASAERFIAEAARDPDVVAIKQTIYRTSRDSPFVASLIRAAEAGKQVAVLVELRARFDESANVRIARSLEKVGAHVAYGVMGLKTHCKASLVVRRETDGLRAYAHLGTGNYNPRTAMLYTDLGLFTCDHLITDDVVELFNLLTGRSRLDTFETLLVAPLNMKRRVIEMIRKEGEIARAHARGEAEAPGRIVAKMNSLADAEVAQELYAASQAGAQVTLFVRGFCCLRPGVPGLSENIRVLSVLGRFLEHSRIFHFGNGRADPLEGEWYIASADWMYRNLNHRVESAVPVHGRANRAKLLRIIQIMSADCRGAWELEPTGSYVPRVATVDAAAESPEALGTFETMIREAGSGTF